MRRICATVLIVIVSATSALAGGLEIFLNDISIHAGSNRDGFAADLSMHFGVPRSRVYYVMDTVRRPADAFMVFELCQMTRRSPDFVISTYKRHHHRGWGAMAHELGVKPGSREFYAVRNGDFGYQPRYYEREVIREYRYEEAPRHGHGKGHDKRHGKG